MRRIPALLGVTLLVTAALAGPAQAAVVESGQETIDETFPGGTCTAPDGTVYTFEGHDVGTESFRGKVRGPASAFDYGAPFFGSTQLRLDQTFTNLDTGLSWSGRYTQQEKDLRILEVDGDELLLLVGQNAHFAVIAPDGTVDSRTNMRFEYTLRIDTMGTPDLDDDAVTFVEVLKEAGTSTVRDFCEDALRFTVPAD